MKLITLPAISQNHAADVLPVRLTHTLAGSIRTAVALRSGAAVTYGSFEIPAAFRAEVHADTHLFVMVVTGVIEVIEGGAGALHFSAGEAFVLPQDGTADWFSANGAVAVFSSCRDSITRPAPRVVAIPLDMERAVSPPYPPELLLSGDPRQAGRCAFADSTGRWRAGVWQSEPYHRKEIAVSKNELMYLHCGSVSFKEPNGSTSFQDRTRPFLVRKGFVSDWNSRTFVFKTFCSDTP